MEVEIPAHAGREAWYYISVERRHLENRTGRKRKKGKAMDGWDALNTVFTEHYTPTDEALDAIVEHLPREVAVQIAIDLAKEWDMEDTLEYLLERR